MLIFFFIRFIHESEKIKLNSVRLNLKPSENGFL
jgi:hypothetical protein